MKVVFKCHRNGGEFEEVKEIDDDVDDAFISEMFEDWVWENVANDYSYEIIK